MKLTNIFRPKRWGLVIAIQDIISYRKFISSIKIEARDPKSKYNLYKMKHNMFYTLYLTVSLEDSDDGLDFKMKRFRVFEILRPIHEYLDTDLGFAGKLAPEFSQFFDDKGRETLSYAAIYRFVFDKLSLFWVLKWGILILGTTLFFKYDLHKYIYEWIISYLI
jgi:hypothetical protein